MARAKELQRVADASEADATRRYIRQQRLAVVVEEAMRRSQTMSRLEASLLLVERRPTA